MTTDPRGVCVFAPTVLLTVTVEAGEDEDEIHFHAGGQGFWVARQLGRLGVATTLCAVFGGEAGRVARSMADLEALEIRAVGRARTSGAYVHDRRDGERRVVAENRAAPVTRHDADELYGATLATAFEAGVCVLTGPSHPDGIGPGLYRRLASDLSRNGVEVIADLSGRHLDEALAGGVSLCKVSEEDLRRDGTFLHQEDRSVGEAVRRLSAAGANRVVITRAERPLVAALGDEVGMVCPPRLESADHRGAGDAFTAVVTAARFWGMAWNEAVEWGAAAGALTTARHGLATADRREIHRLVPKVRSRWIRREP